MMKNNCVQIKYSGVLKEISFYLKKEGINQDCPDILKKYENRRGEFVLQKCGLNFLKDIECCFDENSTVLIEFLGTNDDYNDLVNLVNKYNSQSIEKTKVFFKCTKMNNVSLIPGIDLVESIFKFGEESYKILDEYSNKISKINLSSVDNQDISVIKSDIESLISSIRIKGNELQEKMNAFRHDNYVNICVVGQYSSGKSLLINSLLGKMILPISIEEKTAKVFSIQSPKKKNDLIVKYSEAGVRKTLRFDYSINKFSGESPYLEDLVGNPIEQMYSLLTRLNSSEDVDANIDLYVEIPFDTDTIHFRFYDTPGGDTINSNNINTLKTAISNQNETILVYVLKPDGVGGIGNNIIFDYISNLNDKDDLVSIDMDRSLFVFNKSEGNVLDRKAVSDKSFLNGKLDLSNKNVLFTSAVMALVSKMVEEKFISSDTKLTNDNNDYKLKSFDRLYGDLHDDPDDYLCFKQNHYGSINNPISERNIDREDEAYKNAERKKNATESLYIASGVNALVNQFLDFGKKYSTILKASAIIDVVTKISSDLLRKIKRLQSDNSESLMQINQEIAQEKDAFFSLIRPIFEKCSTNKSFLSEEQIRLLKLDSDSILSSKEEFLDMIPVLFNNKKTREIKSTEGEKFKNEICELMRSYFTPYVRSFNEKKRDINKTIISDLVNEISSAVANSEHLSKGTKEYIDSLISDIPEYYTEYFTPDIDEIYNQSLDKVGFFKGFIHNTKKQFEKLVARIKKEEFEEKNIFDLKVVKKQVSEEWPSIFDKFSEQVKSDFENSVINALESLKHYFHENIESLNSLIQLKLKSKKIIEEVNDILVIMDDKLENALSEIKKEIWRI